MDAVRHNGVPNLLELSAEKRQAFIDSFDYVMTDCDGTVWMLQAPLAGTDEGIAALQKHGKRIVYLSNNAARDAARYELKFKESNIRATFEDVIHPGTAAVDYLRQIKFDGLIYLIGTTVLKDYLTENGFEVCTGNWEPIEETITALLHDVKDDRPVRAVLIDWDFNLTMRQLHKAQLYLRNKECLFVALATDEFLGFQMPIIGPGPFYKAVERAVGRPAIVLGKPGVELRDLVLSKYGITDPKRVLFIGDMLEQDIGFGSLCGFQTLTVLTGSIREQHVQRHTVAAEVPDYFLPRFADFAAVCKDLKCRNAD